MTAFKDHFSHGARDYAVHRPHYPAALVDALAALVPDHDVAWDVGCGNGQLSAALTARFSSVVGTDASAAQIAAAGARTGVVYRCAPAEASGLAAESVDLTVAAQAAHWFDLPAFYAEVRRVSRRSGVIVLISYGVLRGEAEVDGILQTFYWETLGPFWPPERRIVEEGYAGLPFPFEALPVPPLVMEAQWNLSQLLGYVGTWSSIRPLMQSDQAGERERFERQLTAAWGAPERLRRIRWPLAVRAGHVFGRTGQG